MGAESGRLCTKSAAFGVWWADAPTNGRGAALGNGLLSQSFTFLYYAAFLRGFRANA